MTLEKYQKKRKFEKTPEPKGTRPSPKAMEGKSIKDKKSRVFVVQKHNAQNLHYDLRLAMGGVLKSWAIPKIPSKNPKIKRLAIQVEDHPLEYAKFKGTIPKGEYGAGTVEIWDKGKYQLKEGNLKKGHLQIKFDGDKLKSRYHLIRTKGFQAKNSWLFFKAKD